MTALVPSMDPGGFRDDFFTHLTHGGVDEAAASKHVYRAPPNVAKPSSLRPSTDRKSIAPFDAFYVRVHPSALDDYGALQSRSRVADIESTFEAGPVLIPLRAGIFGELIEDRPVEPLQPNRDSSSARGWKAAASAAGDQAEGKVKACSLAELGYDRVPIQSTIVKERSHP